LIERAGFDSTACLGSVVASFPDFLDLFATEAPAAGVELTIAHLALLFTDLTGSTALYGKVGDAKAFAVVQEHFRDMSAVVGENRGAVVKTMGDAVMASFSSESDAVAAAIAMLERCDTHHGALGLSVANERLDFFGTTVNLAARLQARAKGGQLVITEELASHPRVQTLIVGFRKAPFRAALKGIAVEQNLLAIDVVSPHP
jgi:class 3 adenylate cyclase